MTSFREKKTFLWKSFTTIEPPWLKNKQHNNEHVDVQRFLSAVFQNAALLGKWVLGCRRFFHGHIQFLNTSMASCDWADELLADWLTGWYTGCVLIGWKWTVFKYFKFLNIFFTFASKLIFFCAFLFFFLQKWWKVQKLIKLFFFLFQFSLHFLFQQLHCPDTDLNKASTEPQPAGRATQSQVNRWTGEQVLSHNLDF